MVALLFVVAAASGLHDWRNGAALEAATIDLSIGRCRLSKQANGSECLWAICAICVLLRAQFATADYLPQTVLCRVAAAHSHPHAVPRTQSPAD